MHHSMERVSQGRYRTGTAHNKLRRPGLRLAQSFGIYIQESQETLTAHAETAHFALGARLHETVTPEIPTNLYHREKTMFACPGDVVFCDEALILEGVINSKRHLS